MERTEFKVTVDGVQGLRVAVPADALEEMSPLRRLQLSQGIAMLEEAATGTTPRIQAILDGIDERSQG